MEDLAVQEAYARLWVFADKHMIPALENRVLGEFYSPFGRTFPAISTIRYVYENTGPGSSARQLMIDLLCSGLARPLEEQKDSSKVVFHYSGEDVGSMGEIPGFTEDLANSYQTAMHIGQNRYDIVRSYHEYEVAEGDVE